MIQLRDVLPNELSNLGELCLRSKAVWGYDDAFMAACRAELMLRPDELCTTHLQVAERDAIVIGVVQLKVVDRDADLMKLFVEPALLGSGAGRLLFEWAIAKARTLGAVRMTIRRIPARLRFTSTWARAVRVLLFPGQFPDGCCRACAWSWKGKRTYRHSRFVR